VCSSDLYNRETGISVYQAPSVKPGQFYMYFDPISQLSAEGRARWSDPEEHQGMCDEALAAARKNER